MIKPGDTVHVSFYNIGITLCNKAEVICTPGDGDSGWLVEDLENGKTHYISEGCTITKNKEPKNSQKLTKAKK